MADFGEMLLRMMGIGGTGPGADPNRGDAAPVLEGSSGPAGTGVFSGFSQSGAGPETNDPMGNLSSTPPGPPALATGRSVAAPAATIALPPGAGAGVPPSAGGASVGGPATPPDLSALYTKLVEDNKREAGFNQGLNLIAAGFASPANRAALINAPTTTGPDPATALQTLMAIRNDQVKQQNTATDRGNLPGIAAKLGIDLPTATTLYNSGKLSDVLTDFAKPHTQVVGDGKTGWKLVDTRDGHTIQTISEGTGGDETTAQKKIDAAQKDWQKYNLPDPSDPANAQFWKDFNTKIFAPGGGTSVSVQTGDTAFNKHVAEKVYGPAVEAGTNALSANHTLDYMRNLALNAKEDLPQGPAALIDLKAREGLGAALGVTIAGVPEAEGIQKLNQALATATVRAISSRPTQMEFAKALENNPGLLQSRAGMMMMIELLKQDNSTKAQIGSMALDPANHNKDWITNVDNVYKNNPLKSPFDANRAFGKEDIEILSDPKRTNIVDGKMYFQKDGKWFKADSN